MTSSLSCFNPNKSIITSLLDMDFYKLTMMQWALLKQPEAVVEYKFKCRNNIDLTPYMAEINHELDELCKLRFQDSEIRYLSDRKRFPYLREGFLAVLSQISLDRRAIIIRNVDGQLDIRVKGPWFMTILFEIFVLAIVNEVYMRNIMAEDDFSEGRRRLTDKIRIIQEEAPDITFADFGTRRRAAKEWQLEVLQRMQKELPKNLVGTSNVWLAKELGLTPIGTMAHEFLQANQQIDGVQLRDFQKNALQGWADVYRGDLGIALTDVVGLDAFLKDFDKYFAMLFSGVRHDSGCPFNFADRVIEHYKSLGIDPKTKAIVWSDGLKVRLMIDLFNAYKAKVLTGFGWGTDLTNDLGYETLQIVMKMVYFNGRPVAKLSDSPGKGMCEEPKFVELLSNTFGVPVL